MRIKLRTGAHARLDPIANRALILSNPLEIVCIMVYMERCYEPPTCRYHCVHANKKFFEVERGGNYNPCGCSLAAISHALNVA